MIRFEFNGTTIDLYQLWELTYKEFINRFPESRVIYSHDFYREVFLECSTVFGIPLASVALNYNHEQLDNISVKWHHSDSLSFKQRKRIAKSTIQSIKKSINGKPVIIKMLFGIRQWQISNYLLTYRFFEHFVWDEEIIIKRK